MANVISLKDNFDDNSLNTNLWTKFEAGNAVLKEVHNRLEIDFPTSATSSTDGDISSVSTYDIRSGYAKIQIITVPRAATNADAIFRLQKDLSNYFQWIYEAGTLYAQRRIAASTTTVTSFAFSPVTHKYWRIREASGTIYWETSANGTDWTERGTYAYSIDVSVMTVLIAGVCYQAETSPGSFIVDNFNTTAEKAQKSHQYKIFRNANYLGLLDNVTSLPAFRQRINSAAVETVITAQANILTATEEVEPLLTEAGEEIQTEAGQTLYVERQPDVIGSSSDKIKIRTNNVVEIWEFDQHNPDGILLFTGYISRYKARIGQGEDSVIITAISDGVDLDQYIFGNNTYVLEISATNEAQLLNVNPQPANANIIQQTFTPGSTFNLNKVAIKAASGDASHSVSSVNLVLSVFQGNPAGGRTLLGTSNVTIANQYPTFAEVEFTFSEVIPLTSGTQYFIAIEPSNYSAIRISTTSNPYANGDAYFTSADYTQVFGPFTTQDMYFKLYSGTLLTDASFNNYDPSDIIRDAIDGYISQGGLVSYSASTIDDTGYSLDYDFITATVLEIIQKARELAPANWYWYVDVASRLLYFKEVAATATHKFVLGQHISSLEIEPTVEDIVNVIYFTGGDTGLGENLLKLYLNNESLSLNRRGMRRYYDNRVSIEATADTIADSLLDENAEEITMAMVQVSDQDYDIRSIKPGDTVGFAGFRNFIDDLVLQVVELETSADSVTLSLGRLPFKSDAYVDKIKRDLEKEQTLANPDSAL